MYKHDTLGCLVVQSIESDSLTVVIVRRPDAANIDGAVAKLRINSFQNSMVCCGWVGDHNTIISLIFVLFHVRVCVCHLK